MPPPSPVHAYIDGASRGNPGPAAYGVIFKSANGKPIARISRRLGKTTNNVAEYRALLAALEYALEHQVARLKVFSDSELLTRQINGVYKVRSADLKPLHESARALMARLESCSLTHIPRERNREADGLANAALDETEQE